MYTIDISETFGPEYVGVTEDILRTVVIQLVIHTLLTAIDGDNSFFSPYFWIVLLYILVGTLVYYLIFKKLVVIV